MTPHEHKELTELCLDWLKNSAMTRTLCSCDLRFWLDEHPPTTAEPSVPVAKLRELVEEWAGQASRLMVDEHPTSVAIGVLTESHAESLHALLPKVEEGGE